MDTERKAAFDGLLALKVAVQLDSESRRRLDSALSYLVNQRDTRVQGMIEAAEFVESLKLRNLGEELRRRAAEGH